MSRGTLRRAPSTLIAEGALVQVRGKGTFVTSTVVEPAIAQKLTSLSEDFADVGAPLSTRVLECAVVEPPRPVAALLDAPAGQPILRLERLRSTAAGPVALLANFVRTDLAPGLETVDFEENTSSGSSPRGTACTSRRDGGPSRRPLRTARQRRCSRCGRFAGAAPRAGDLSRVRFADRVLRRLDPVGPAPRHVDPDPPLTARCSWAPRRLL